MDTLNRHLSITPTPQPSAAVLREVEALRAMLGLPLEEPEPDGRAPPRPAAGAEDTPPESDTPLLRKTEGEQL